MKTEILNSDPFCEARLVNIENQGHATDKFLVELQDEETQEFREISGVGAVHGADYQLVTNQQARDMAVNVMDNTGMNFKALPTYGSSRAMPTFWNGRRFSQKWFCEDTATAIPGGSSMMLGLEAINSYDGSAKVGLAFFALNVVCSNQFYSNRLMGRPFEFAHINRGGTLDEDIGDAIIQIQGQARNFAKLAPNMDTLAGVDVGDFTDFLKLRTHINNETKVNFHDKQLLDELTGNGVTNELKMKDVKYNDTPTYWDVANAYTAIATHSVGGPLGTSQSGRVVDWLLKDALEIAHSA